MKQFLQHIIFVAILTVVLFTSCNMGKSEIIPRDDLSEIYAEILITDQWISSNSSIRKVADTSLVYKPILERYGYDVEDYMATVDFYMNDTERFAKILEKTVKILEKRLEDAESRKKIKDELELREKNKIIVEIDIEEFFPYITKEPYVHYYDSLTFIPDSTDMVYRLIPIETSDTTYSGLVMEIRTDTLQVKDTVAALIEDKPKFLHQELKQADQKSSLMTSPDDDIDP